MLVFAVLAERLAVVAEQDDESTVVSSSLAKLGEEPRQLAVGATILITGIGGNLALKDGLFPFQIPVIFPNGIPAIVFAAMVGILLNLIFLVLPPSKFGVEDRENLND